MTRLAFSFRLSIKEFQITAEAKQSDASQRRSTCLSNLAKDLHLSQRQAPSLHFICDVEIAHTHNSRLFPARERRDRAFRGKW